jgi:hypothetical protein
VYCGKVDKALSTAVLTALLVKEMKAILSGLVPFLKYFFKILSIKV